MATLVITDGPGTGSQFALADHQLVMIGRDDTCTFQVLDDQVSRRHLQIRRSGETGGTGGHIAHDFKSANGVQFNGAKMTEDRPLTDGDRMRIGDTTILYTTADSPDAKAIDELMRTKGQWHRSTMVRD